MVVPETSSDRTGYAPGRRARPRLPLWLRWVLSLAVFSALIVALIRLVDNNGSPAQATTSNSAVVQQNEQAEAVVAADQAPHTTRLQAGAAPAAALDHAVRADMAAKIARRELDGPLQRSSCAPAGGTKAKLGFRCTVQAGGVAYPFVGVVDVAAREITYCKRDPPPVPSENVPVSPRCTIR